LEDAGLATSGDYRNFRQTEAGFISHTLDPRTGRPTTRRTASVSVVRRRAAEADALATGLSVLDPSEALDLAAEHDWAVLLLIHQDGGGFRALESAAWKRLDFEVVAP
jgi:thiamine biosynthesis lipoprotein